MSITQHKPEIPPWVPAPPSVKTDFDWAPLATLDLFRVTGDDYTEVPDDVVEEAGKAFHEDGFVYALNHGLPWDYVKRQFAIGQYAFDGVPPEEKDRLKADILRTGSFTGYKAQGHWKLNSVPDRIEQFNVVSTRWQPQNLDSSFPPQLKPFIDEIHEFTLHNQRIYRQILTVLSRVLKLPPDYLWRLSQNPEEKGVDLLRYAAYYAPPNADDKAVNGVRLQGHSDFNAVTLLWSQPITSLEVLMPDNKWRFVRHIDNALVLNLGDVMHFLSGGYLKQTIHRVVAPPEDQAQYVRLGTFYFAFPNADVPLLPLTESPVVRKVYGQRSEGFWEKEIARGGHVPTAGEWEGLRVKAYGQEQTKKRDDGHETETINGFEIVQYNDPKTQSQQPPRLREQLLKEQPRLQSIA